MSDNGNNVQGVGQPSNTADAKTGVSVGLASRRRSDVPRWVKAAFVVVVIAAACLIYLKQRSGPAMADEWREDLSEGLARAKATNCRSLLFFVNDPMGQQDRWVIDNVLTTGENRQAMADGKYVCIRVMIPSLSTSDEARRYSVSKLPTLLLLDSAGVELNRREVKLGQTEFRNGFLDCAVVVRAGTSGK